MSAPMKKRGVVDEKRSKESSSSDEESDEVDEEFTKGEEIQVDFEGRNPDDADFHGIKTLLNQLFLKAHVNLSELTDLIIGQNYVGSVVKQCDVDGEDSDDETDANDVFGITTVVNITEKQEVECVRQLRALLLRLAEEHADADTKEAVRDMLQNVDAPVGLLVNERFVNIPAQIAVPLLTNLRKEMARAVEKKMAFQFGRLVVISKLYKMEVHKKKGPKGPPQTDIIWSNPEDEIIDQMATHKFEFCVAKDSDSGATGAWEEDDVPMTPFRRVLILPADQLPAMIQRITAFITAPP